MSKQNGQRRVPPLYPIREKFKRTREWVREADEALGGDSNAARQFIHKAIVELQDALELEQLRHQALDRRAAEAEEARQARVAALKEKLAELEQ